MCRDFRDLVLNWGRAGIGDLGGGGIVCVCVCVSSHRRSKREDT